MPEYSNILLNNECWIRSAGKCLTNSAEKRTLRLSKCKYSNILLKNECWIRNAGKCLTKSAEKRILRLSKRKYSIISLKNELASKNGFVFHVMVSIPHF